MTSHPNGDGDQLKFDLGVEQAAGWQGVDDSPGTCPICGGSLAGVRANALYCGPPCRAEASRVRRLREGKAVDGYQDLAAYAARRKRTQVDRSSGANWRAPTQGAGP